MKLSLLPSGIREQYGGGVDNIEIKRRMDFYEKVMEEKEKAAGMEEEIERIRKLREEADVEIENLKDILEEE